jgi:signal-transduction protein with cAMP-binding, CBS, and nucleotidyltransferase domain
MERVQESHGVALGLFHRLIPDNTHGPHKGKLNLKYHGLLPLVENIRLLSLREGIMATSTLTRIDTLHEHGILSGNEQDYLSGAFYHITQLILRQQVADFLADQAVGPYVPPSALSDREKDMLVAGLVAIDELSNRVRTEFTGDIF